MENFLTSTRTSACKRHLLCQVVTFLSTVRLRDFTDFLNFFLFSSFFEK